MEDDLIMIPISSDMDIVTARQKARELARQIGFVGSELAVIATAISELARNILEYAKKGTIQINVLSDRKGILIIAQDEGPGIQNIDLALQDGYSTSNSLGLGLPGVRRLMDSFKLQSIVGQGTTVIIEKWAE